MHDQPTVLPEPISSDGEQLSAEQRIGAWADIFDACEQFLLAGSSKSLDPRASNRLIGTGLPSMEEHDRMMFHLMEEFDRRSARHAPEQPP
jgi:hypothetical protein